MHLNSILFPAPKCSYTVELLKEELIWIPKYAKRPSGMQRLHTVGAENFRSSQYECHTLETPRNLIPQLKSKKPMPYSPKLMTKLNKTLLQNPKFQPKTPILNDEQCHNHVKKLGPKPIEITESSMQEISSVYDEKTENSQIDIRENHFKLFAEKFAEKAKDNPPASYNVSVDDVDSSPALLAGQMLLEKKFIITGSNLINKEVKTIATTRDTSSFTDIENTPQIRCKIPFKKKPSMKKNLETLESEIFSEEHEFNYDEEVVDEHYTQMTTACSPRNVYRYETKVFSNPHSRSANLLVNRKVLTECADYSPERNERTGRIFSRFGERAKLANRMSLYTPLFEDPVEHYIPCLLLRPRLPTNKVILYFHGNGEDVHLARELLSHVRDQLNINVIAVEYPGYGLYKGTCSEAQVQVDAEAVFDYLTSKIGLHPRNIVVFGRSIGSGPATWLASRKNIGALVLMSAFTSIRAVVQHLAGRWAQYLVKERFNNLDHISRVTCPTFIVHGLKDKLIPFEQAQELYNKCKGLCELVLPKDMDHIEFDFHEDFTNPLLEFLHKISFGLDSGRSLKVTFPPELFVAPKESAEKMRGYMSPRY